ncbi:MAG: site-2 protease family protein, partial [Rhodospirillales bacterium]|nr:site-2 protease family protein [Rhodospirillales bacterium]
MLEHAFHLITGFWNYVIVFLFILTVVVFIHELGHYWVARRNGVKVEVFSIGFGKELYGWTTAAGTRWRISLLPFGGYVKMFGDEDVTSGSASDQPMTAEEKAVSFHHKRVGQRAAVVFAGPAANFLFGIVVLSLMFMTVGQPMTPAVVGRIQDNSAAVDAGLRIGDRVLKINDSAIERFQDIQHIVRLRIGEPLILTVQRDGQTLQVTAQPRITEVKDVLGNVHRIPVLGIGAAA